MCHTLPPHEKACPHASGHSILTTVYWAQVSQGSIHIIKRPSNKQHISITYNNIQYLNPDIYSNLHMQNTSWSLFHIVLYMPNPTM